MNKESYRIKPLDLAFDIDGVFADTFRVFIRTAKSDYGIEIAYETVTEYDFWNILKIDEEICREIIERILDDPLGMGIVPMGGAVDVLTELSRVGRLLFVTARPDKDSICRWVQRQLPAVKKRDIRVEATGVHEGKTSVLLKHGAKYFIEDHLDTCYLLNEASVTPIVYEQPWNQKPHPFKSVKSWDEISAMIVW